MQPYWQWKGLWSQMLVQVDNEQPLADSANAYNYHQRPKLAIVFEFYGIKESNA
jgi:hypothetical protein